MAATPPIPPRTLAAVLGVEGNNTDLGAAYDRVFGPEEIAWFKGQTGIEDDAELKKHVLDVEEEAWKIFPYACIRMLTFARTLIRHIPAYSEALKLGRERNGALFLDFACCFGNDLRIAVADGFPAEQTLAADLYPEFWTLGHKLFCSTPETFPAHFFPCDIFNPAQIAPAEPTYHTPPKPVPSPLSSASTLTEFQGHISVIHTSAFFHLFDKDKQRLAAKTLASLLSPLPGSMIFGLQAGRKEASTWTTEGGHTSFVHSPESWAEIWDGGVFEKGTVKVESTLIDFFNLMRKGEPAPADLPEDIAKELQKRGLFLAWSVTRL